MLQLWNRALSRDARFVIRRLHGVDLLYRTVEQGTTQLVLPAG